MTTTKKPATKVSEKTVQEITKVWNTGSAEKITDLFTEDATFQHPQLAQAIAGKNAIKSFLEQQHVSFPDQQIQLQTAIVQGNKGAATGTWSATNTGPLPTPDGKTIPATNKKVTGEWAAFVTFDTEGKVKAFKLYADNLAVFHQLGIAHPQ